MAVAKALEAVLRQDRGRIMATLAWRLGSLQLAEDALQEASLSAMVHWARSGLPHSPQGWLIRDLHMNGASFFFIADIDSPRYGVIRVVPQNLNSLAQSLAPK